MTFDPDADYRRDPVADLIARFRREAERTGAFVTALEGLDPDLRAEIGWPTYIQMLYDQLDGEEATGP